MRVELVHKRVLKNESHAEASGARDIMVRHMGIIEILRSGSKLLGSHHKVGKGAGGHSIETPTDSDILACSLHGGGSVFEKLRRYVNAWLAKQPTPQGRLPNSIAAVSQVSLVRLLI